MEEKEVIESMSLNQVKKPWYRLITVEPTLFLYMMAFMLTSVVENLYFNYKACTVNHNFTHEICMELEKHDEIKKEVQKTASSFIQYNSIAGQVIPIILAFFMGAFSDRRGRKLPLIMGLIGKFIYSSMVVVNTTMPHWPVEYIIYTATIPSAFTGADVAIFANAFSYISDVSTKENRTLRITILDVCYLSTMPTGVFIGNYLFKYLDKSFTKMFIINAALLFLSIVYSLVNLKWQTTAKQKPLSDIPCSKWPGDFFDKKHFMQSIRSLTKKRDKNYRTYILLIMAAMAFYAIQRNEKSYMYLYTQLKLNWNFETYSNFRTYQSASYVIVMLIAVPIFNKILNWKDTILVAIGACGHSIGRIFFATASNSALMYAGASVASFGPIVAPAIRSITSKLVSSDERGTVFSLLSVCDNAIQLVSGIFYTQIYNNTLESFPPAIFLFTIFTQLCLFAITLFIHIRRRHEERDELQPIDALIDQGQETK